jgi:hypothetical protein
MKQSGANQGQSAPEIISKRRQPRGLALAKPQPMRTLIKEADPERRRGVGVGMFGSIGMIG